MNFRCVIQPKRNLAGVGYTGESGLLGVAYAGESGLTGVGYTSNFGLPGVAYTGENRLFVWFTQRTPPKFFLTRTHRHRLHWGVWTHWCSLHQRVWTQWCRQHRQEQTPQCSLHRWVISPTFKAYKCSWKNNSWKSRLWVLSTGN